MKRQLGPALLWLFSIQQIITNTALDRFSIRTATREDRCLAQLAVARVNRVSGNWIVSLKLHHTLVRSPNWTLKIRNQLDNLIFSSKKIQFRSTKSLIALNPDYIYGSVFEDSVRLPHGMPSHYSARSEQTQKLETNCELKFHRRNLTNSLYFFNK